MLKHWQQYFHLQKSKLPGSTIDVKNNEVFTLIFAIINDRSLQNWQKKTHLNNFIIFLLYCFIVRFILNICINNLFVQEFLLFAVYF